MLRLNDYRTNALILSPTQALFSCKDGAFCRCSALVFFKETTVFLWYCKELHLRTSLRQNRIPFVICIFSLLRFLSPHFLHTEAWRTVLPTVIEPLLRMRLTEGNCGIRTVRLSPEALAVSKYTSLVERTDRKIENA